MNTMTVMSKNDFELQTPCDASRTHRYDLDVDKRLAKDAMRMLQYDRNVFKQPWMFNALRCITNTPP